MGALGQNGHLSSLIILLYLPVSIANLCDDSLNVVIYFAYIMDHNE